MNRADLESFASRTKEINIDGDCETLNDDLGISLMTNQNKVQNQTQSPRRVDSVPNSSSQGQGQVPYIQIKQIDDMEVVNLDSTPGANDIRVNRTVDTPDVTNIGFGHVSNTSNTSDNDTSIQKERLLTKIRRFERKGIQCSRLTSMNSLAEIKAEFDKLADSQRLESSILFQRSALITVVSGIEQINSTFGHRLPTQFRPKLKGWSESVNSGVDQFDDIFEELYDLYKDSANMHPILRLVTTLGMSAAMYHITNTIAEQSGIPGLSDLLHENPALQQQMMAAAMSKMGGMGKFMSSMATDGGTAQHPVPVSVSVPVSVPVVAPGLGSVPIFGGTRGVPFNVSSAAAMDEQTFPKRREMRGPTGSNVDDVIRAFEAERAVQSGPGISSVHSTIFTPDGPPPTPPRNGRAGVGSASSDPLMGVNVNKGGGGLDGYDMDVQSVESGGTSNTERRRGRRRAEPVGATLNLNV